MPDRDPDRLVSHLGDVEPVLDGALDEVLAQIGGDGVGRLHRRVLRPIAWRRDSGTPERSRGRSRTVSPQYTAIAGMFPSVNSSAWSSPTTITASTSASARIDSRTAARCTASYLRRWNVSIRLLLVGRAVAGE